MSKPTGLFRGPDGQNYLLTFSLITSLFFLWAMCNGMIDVMDKHFQDYLHLSKRQSAWVQFAHYLGYFLMALPAGWLARKIGYKGGIIGGLLMVAAGCLWFIPATQISTFWAFLLGVCDRDGAYFPGDDSQSLHDGAGVSSVCGGSYQYRPDF